MKISNSDIKNTEEYFDSHVFDLLTRKKISNDQCLLMKRYITMIMTAMNSEVDVVKVESIDQILSLTDYILRSDLPRDKVASISKYIKRSVKERYSTELWLEEYDDWIYTQVESALSVANKSDKVSVNGVKIIVKDFYNAFSNKERSGSKQSVSASIKRALDVLLGEDYPSYTYTKKQVRRGKQCSITGKQVPMGKRGETVRAFVILRK